MSTLEIAYTGQAVDDGSMDVREAAPAMLALGNLLVEANRVLNGSNVRASVRIRAFKHGSADTLLELVQNYGPSVGATLAANMHWSADDVVRFVAGTGRVLCDGLSGKVRDSIWELVKLLKEKKTEKAESMGDGNVKLTLRDNNGTINIVISEAQHRIAESPKARRHVAESTEPVERNSGISGMDVRSNGKTISRITKDDVPALKAAVAGEARELKPTRAETWLDVVGPVFEEGKKWALKAPRGDVMTLDVPEEYWEDYVKAGERFGLGDALFVELETRTSVTDGVMSHLNRIIRVLDHHRRGEQTWLAKPPSGGPS